MVVHFCTNEMLEVKSLSNIVLQEDPSQLFLFVDDSLEGKKHVPAIYFDHIFVSIALLERAHLTGLNLIPCRVGQKSYQQLSLMEVREDPPNFLK